MTTEDGLHGGRGCRGCQLIGCGRRSCVCQRPWWGCTWLRIFVDWGCSWSGISATCLCSPASYPNPSCSSSSKMISSSYSTPNYYPSPTPSLPSQSSQSSWHTWTTHSTSNSPQYPQHTGTDYQHYSQSMTWTWSAQGFVEPHWSPHQTSPCPFVVRLFSAWKITN